MNEKGKWYGLACVFGGIVIGTVSLFRFDLYAPIVSSMFVCTGAIILSR